MKQYDPERIKAFAGELRIRYANRPSLLKELSIIPWA
jgi:hypothetical protein